MNYLIPSFLAGMLTVLAPCILALLPIILGGSATSASKWRPLIITVSLGVSVILFTLLLKVSTFLIDIPTSFWGMFSGVIISLFALTMVFPSVWDKISFKLGFYKSEGLIGEAGKREGPWGAVLLGMAMGPVFNTCSPTYLLLLSVVFPANFWVGLLNLFSYTLGLMALMLVIGYGGHAIVKKLRFAANPNGWFKRGLGVLLLVVGVGIVMGWDKALEAWIITPVEDGGLGFMGPIEIEQALIGK